MNPAQVLDHFDRMSDAPDAIPRLRRFVLELAVRGKLVEEDRNDEPASELLKLIRTKKARLVEEGKIKPQELASITDGSMPFQVPKHWEWLRLSDLGVLSGGMTPSKNRPDFWDGDINWFSPKDIKSNELFESELKITSIGVSETGLQLYRPGCLFMVARSGILKRTFPVAINRVQATANQDLKVLTPFIEGLDRYLQIMFGGMTDFVLSALVKTGTPVQSLKYDEFEAQPVPLPPLAEQHRIVFKVDESMALCDRLEAAQAGRERRRHKLAAASLHRLNNGADANEFRKHAGFHIHHLPRLTTRPEHIQQLRQTILNLAVRGKLVHQDPKDQPTTELLKLIQMKKKQLGSKENIDPSIKMLSDGMQFKIPPSWVWVCVRDIALRISDGVHKKPTYVKEGVPFITVKNLTEGPGISFRDTKFISKTDHQEFLKRTS